MYPFAVWDIGNVFVVFLYTSVLADEGILGITKKKKRRNTPTASHRYAAKRALPPRHNALELIKFSSRLFPQTTKIK